MLVRKLAQVAWNIHANWQIYRRLLAIRIRGQMHYRVSFWFDIITGFATTVIAFATLALVLQKFDNVGGWTLGEVALLYGLVETAFGMTDMIFSGFDPQFFGNQVRLGRLDQMLLRPVNLTLQVLSSEFVLRRLGRIAQGLGVLFISFSLTPIEWTLAKVIYLPLIILGLLCFFGGLFMIGATITFWTIESVEFINIFTYGGTEMMSYPMHIYSDGMRRFFTYILPAIFLNYYPALYILNKPDPLQMPGWAPFVSPLAGLSVLLAALLFWRFGVHHYQSAGT